MLLILAALLFGSFAFGADETEEPSNFESELMGLGFRVFREPADAPDFKLEDLQGNKVPLASFEGKLVFLNFWATWCRPCRAEMPSMQALYESLGNESFEIVAINLRESRNLVQEFVDEFEFTFPVLLDTSGQVWASYGPRYIPTSYLIGPDGKAIGFMIGSRTWEDPEVESLFRELTAR